MFSKLMNMFSGTRNFNNLSSREFEQEIKNNPRAVVIDVRTPGEFNSGHIKGAKNIDVMQPGFENKVAGFDKSKTYYLYCQAGSRSARACQVMASSGFENLNNLSGGMLSWRGDVK